MGITLLEFVALFVTVIFLAYVVMIVVPFLRRAREEPGDANQFHWHFLVPARDEEAVITQTLDACERDFPMAHLWVIDDASDDSTAALVAAVARGNPRVHLVRRFAPDARTGK